MFCSKCGTQNPAAKRFCSQCGTALPRLCSRCGAENVPTSKFCGDCGNALIASASSSLASATIAQIPSSEPQTETLSSANGERKTITALFADIKGSMELIEDLDPE
jgi:uncharacterized membrane protein YvbJ